MIWGIQINGDLFDLKELTKLLNDDEIRIYDKNGQYFFESSKFENLTTSAEVASLASDILKGITGAVRLYLGSKTPLHIVRIARIRPNGGRDVFITSLGTSNSKGTIDIEKRRIDGTTEVNHTADNLTGWIKLGLKNQKVAKALRLFGTGELDWVSLYRIYEVIEEDVGSPIKIVSCGWTSMSSIKRFKHTANSPSAVGDASRHGKPRGTSPSESMGISDAIALIMGILNNWLRSKV